MRLTLTVPPIAITQGNARVRAITLLRAHGRANNIRVTAPTEGSARSRVDVCDPIRLAAGSAAYDLP